MHIDNIIRFIRNTKHFPTSDKPPINSYEMIDPWSECS